MRWKTHKNITAPPAARIRRVVFDHAASAAVFVYSHASSMVISPAAAEGEMLAMLVWCFAGLQAFVIGQSILYEMSDGSMRA